MNRISSIVELAQRLVRVPSQAGIDDPGGVLNAAETWLEEHELPVSQLMSDQQVVGLLIQLPGSPNRPVLCLNACIDTAPVGDRGPWRQNPFGGEIADGHLYGRGAADSKMGAAIFCHLAEELCSVMGEGWGELHVLLDADEHTGRFAGAKSYLKSVARKPDVVAIGYPGNYGVVVGARGFCRFEIEVSGIAGHSGGRSPRETNAIVRAAELIQRLSHQTLPEETDAEFQFGPKLTVTEVAGGAGYSQIPDHCGLKIDVRLTPAFDDRLAHSLLAETITLFDRECPGPQATKIEIQETWPAYRVNHQNPFLTELVRCASAEFGREFPQVVCGPSNIGNFLAASDIPALCGFGVGYGNLHAANEYAELNSVAAVYAAYRNATRAYLRQ